MKTCFSQLQTIKVHFLQIIIIFYIFLYGKKSFSANNGASKNLTKSVRFQTRILVKGYFLTKLNFFSKKSCTVPKTFAGFCIFTNSTKMVLSFHFYEQTVKRVFTSIRPVELLSFYWKFQIFYLLKFCFRNGSTNTSQKIFLTMLCLRLMVDCLCCFLELKKTFI